MKKTILFLSVIVFLTSCLQDEPIQELKIRQIDSTYYEASYTDNLQNKEIILNQIDTPKKILKKYEPVVKEQTKVQKIKEIISQKISQTTIDSLNNIYEVFDPTQYQELAITYFSGLADKMNTKAFFAESDEEIMENIMEILTTRLNDGTDIVLLIDKTGSMNDDIEQIKSGLSEMDKFLSKFDNINLSIASYGDSNFHGELWYNSSPLDRDMSKISSFMDSFSTVGNPDTPESVNEAIVKTVSETNWTPGNERLVLVIGDAPSQLPPYSKYNLEDVVNICDSLEVTFNLYPVIIGSKNPFLESKERIELTLNAYPNPAVNDINITFGEVGSYYVTIYNMNGKNAANYQVNGDQVLLDVSSLIPGNYLAQIMSEDLDKNGIVKFIKR